MNDRPLQTGVLRAPPLPAEAPLEMPTQSLRRAPPRVRKLASSPPLIGLRRALVFLPAIVLTGFAAREMYRVLGVNEMTPVAVFMLALFVALFAWIALSFFSAIAGFISVVCGGGRRLLRPGVRPTTRTALLMPTYNESPTRVCAGLAAIDEDLRQAGATDHFDIFILSDTTDPDVWIAEEKAFLDLRERTGGAGRIFYRHRPRNTARKSGNIADWVTRFGGAYPQFLILDADSVMTADALLQLVTAMEANPGVGLIQTLPVITGGTTLFARMQQFAGRVYGPIIAHGIAWWHGAEGNYWGHNAVIRTIAFAEQGGLPELPGRKPFGGHIMSHDFVEAALLRRGGWAVHMVPGLPGSYEESPPSLIDLSIRDRRWCQGNLQHTAVLPTRGLHWINRIHLLTGIGSYITAPLWLLFMLGGIVIALQARFIPPEYFPQVGKSLFPRWPVIDPVRAMWVFIGTMGLLLVPKLLGTVSVMLRRDERRGCGGFLGLLVSLLVETVIAGLIAPVVMLTQSIDVIAILFGRDSGWNAQRRDDGGIAFRDIAYQYRYHTLLGLLLGAGAWAISVSLALWMTPVVLGLALAVPLAALTGRRSLGTAFRHLRLLCTPEERQPPEVLARASAFNRLESEQSQATGVASLPFDEPLLTAHRQMLPPPRRPGIDPLNVPLLVATAKLSEATSLQAAWSDLTAAEKMAALSNDAALDRIVDLGQHAHPAKPG